VPVSVERNGLIAVITLDRAAKRNAINGEMTESIDSALNECEDDTSCRAIIITGGTDVFCAGTDIAEGSGQPTERGGEYGIIRRKSRLPIIAAIEGAAFGGGFEIALACDLIVASRSARFAMPEVKRGLVATSAGLFRVPRAVPINVARELLLTGGELDVERAERLGIVNIVAEDGHAVQAAIGLAEQIAANAPTSIRATLEALDTIYADADETGWAATDAAAGVVLKSEDRVEGVAAFFERRTPDWPGC
jgi:enoyl-CoA hydratase/carnithine racemase